MIIALGPPDPNGEGVGSFETITIYRHIQCFNVALMIVLRKHNFKQNCWPGRLSVAVVVPIFTLAAGPCSELRM
jgi:hypothetical protein